MCSPYGCWSFLSLEIIDPDPFWTVCGFPHSHKSLLLLLLFPAGVGWGLCTLKSSLWESLTTWFASSSWYNTTPDSRKKLPVSFPPHLLTAECPTVPHEGHWLKCAFWKDRRCALLTRPPCVALLDHWVCFSQHIKTQLKLHACCLK